MIDEFIKTIKANLYERATSPLAGAMLISWCLWNYAILIILFSSLEPQQKIGLIQSNLINYSRSIYGPLATSFFFIFVYPFPARIAYEFWRKQKKVLRDIKQKIEDEELLTKEESRAIRIQLYNLQTEHDREVQRKDTEINDLRKSLEEKESEDKLEEKESEDKLEEKESEDKLEEKESEDKLEEKESENILLNLSEHDKSAINPLK